MDTMVLCVPERTPDHNTASMVVNYNSVTRTLTLALEPINRALIVQLSLTTYKKERNNKCARTDLSSPLPPTAMASTPRNALSLLLVSTLILAALAGLSFSCPTRCEKEIVWTLYLRQIGAGPTPNQAQVVPPLIAATAFGQINVNDWDVLDAPEPSANRVARARGTHTKAGQATGDWFTTLSIVFEGARYY